MASQPTRRPGNAGRYLFLFLLGLVVGAVCAVMALRALQARSDPFPDALMQVMSRQSGELGQSAKANRCTANDALPRLQSLRALSNDIEMAFPSLKDDARFATSASALRATLDEALAAPPADCAQLTATAGRIGEDCKACHRDFR
jgi:cytochrome c556